MTVTSSGRARTTAMRIAALAVGGAILLSGCAPEPVVEDTPAPVVRGELTLPIGALLPISGDLKAFGPAARAGIALAVQDINDAAKGITVTTEVRNSGDSADDTAVGTVTKFLDKKVSVIVGAISDGVSKQVIDQIIAAGVVQISPGNTSPDFSRYTDDNLYWRTAPACTLQGEAIAARLLADGISTVGILFQQGYCEPGLPEAIATAFEREKGEVVVQSAYDAASTSLDSQLKEIAKAAPQAVVVVGDEMKPLKLGVTGLADAGYAGSSLYFTGLEIAGHRKDFPKGSIVGSKATRPGVGVTADKEFAARLLAVDPELDDYTYGAESYDAVVLAALAALAANGTTGAEIAGKLREVSGGEGAGQKATDFATAAQLIIDGTVVDYDGPSGSIAFDENGDPTGSVISLYQYLADNTFKRLS